MVRWTNRIFFVVAVAGLVVTAGCASTVALDRAVLAYDKTTADSVSKQLLLNIARARYNQPVHFTAISNIAATYKFGVNAGLGGALTGESGGLLVPLIGASAEENPTISITPMEGEEFTQRLLTPFQEQKLTLLLRQGYDVDSLFRLMGAELRARDATNNLAIYHNRPSNKQGYIVFRQMVAHLSSIQDRQSLYVEPLHFVQSWNVPADTVTPESFNALYKDFSLTYVPKTHTYRVTKKVNGRVMISNYDPALLTNEDRLRLHAEAEEVPANDVLVDIREGYTGGEYPIHGRLRLRSFHEMVTFIGRGIAEEVEFEVPPDARSPAILENPARTLDIYEAKTLPTKTDLSVMLNGNYYAVQDQEGYQWNKKAFSLLYQLFQMSVTSVKESGPAITISK